MLKRVGSRIISIQGPISISLNHTPKGIDYSTAYRRRRRFYLDIENKSLQRNIGSWSSSCKATQAANKLPWNTSTHL